MKLDEFMTTARDAITVKRVFGEPYEKDGVTIITAAAVGGGAGGGRGQDQRQTQEGEGGGFGVGARPVGAYIIKGDTVLWRPAVDVNRVVTMIAAVAIAVVFTRARVEKARAKAAIRTS